ncbi:hypothetical protein JCGZ_22206 [Jatropha curcas]|uniref:Terpene synthase metal-binding domain-containing protein n=1 Tax=Jatropha curcas TaxID=180498 RepID=A0A067K1H7_JATCU|nr:hypothetical protein JCGZ_22206 [Jatropha curcas]
MVSLYEASFLSGENENVLQVARDFTTSYLNNYIKQNKNDNYTSVLITHALKMPLHWRMLRLETRWFIDVYERKQGMNSLLLELAKLDFNYVQAIHQEDLKHTSWWWMNIGLGEKLSFARDRLMENFLWTIGMIFEPEFGYCRRMSTKVNVLLTTIDDVYDVYGTLDELELFTDAVERTPITTDALKALKEYPNITQLSAMIVRLAGDLGTSSDELKRGDVPKSIQCYMHETGVSEVKAHEHIRYLISETWRKINKERVVDSPFSNTFVHMAIKRARIAQCIYEYGDGHGMQNQETKDRILSLLVHPIPYMPNFP